MLLNTRELLNYSAIARDGAAGTVRDLLIDDQSWSVRYLVVDTEGFLSDNNVILSASLVKDVQPIDQEVRLDLTKAEIASSIPASSAPPVSAHHNDPISLNRSKHDPHLRSAVEIGEYTVLASDGELGSTVGLIVETATWSVHYVVVGTGELLSLKQILLAPQAIRSIDWQLRQFKTNLTTEAVHACPEYDGEGEITRQYEAFLHGYYGWHPYWQKV